MILSTLGMYLLYLTLYMLSSELVEVLFKFMISLLYLSQLDFQIHYFMRLLMEIRILLVYWDVDSLHMLNSFILSSARSTSSYTSQILEINSSRIFPPWSGMRRGLSIIQSFLRIIQTSVYAILERPLGIIMLGFREIVISPDCLSVRINDFVLYLKKLLCAVKVLSQSGLQLVVVLQKILVVSDLLCSVKVRDGIGFVSFVV